MESQLLTRAPIGDIGDTDIKSDVKPREFFEGHGSFVTFEPETGGQSIQAVTVTQEESMALTELTKLLSQPTFPAASEVKKYVEERVGTTDWGKITSRYRQLDESR